MNVAEAIRSVREDYVDQLVAFIAAEKAAEPKVELGRVVPFADSTLFARKYVPDVFVPGDPERLSDLVPRARAGKLPPFQFASPDLRVEFEDLWWDDVRIDHNGVFESRYVTAWFRRWFPGETPAAPREEGMGFIHSVRVDEKWITVDLGSAEPRALFELLNVVKLCGGTLAHVSAPRAASDPRFSGQFAPADVAAPEQVGRLDPRDPGIGRVAR